MNYRAACALALIVYALVVVIGATSGHMSPLPFAEFDVPRAVGAVLLAVGVLLRVRVRSLDVLAVAYIVWLGIWGFLAILGPLYQYLVPNAGLTIIRDQVRAGVALSSELALFAAAIALMRAHELAERQRTGSRPISEVRVPARS